MHAEAKTILGQKASEIAKFNELIHEAEKNLASKRREVEKKSKILEGLQNSKDSEFEIPAIDQEYVDSIKASQQEEVEKSQKRHSRHVEKLQRNLEKSLKETEDWAEHHAGVIALEKKAQLDSLRLQMEQMRVESDRTAFSAADARTKLLDQSKSISRANTQRVQFLETQVAEITAVTREELRDIRGKIEECLTAVEIRDQEHKNDRSRYHQELEDRQNQYIALLDALKNQHLGEKQRLDQEITSSQARISHLQTVLKELDRHHETQLRTTLGDIEKMKGSLYQTMTRGKESETDRELSLTELRDVRRECRQIEGEVQIVENEIRELTAENQQLKADLARLDSVVYGK
jgi:chromosome segregation ATPase